MRMQLAGWGYNIHRTTTGDAGLIGILFVQTLFVQTWVVQAKIGAPGA
jgi:hypothetical protein